jgi:hypothetical protein
MNKTCNNCLHRELCNVHGYIDADECACFKDKSRYIELPCAVGDTVYMIFENEIRKLTVISLSYLFTSSFKHFNLHTVNSRGAVLGYEMKDFGKTVFLTREEAEQVLQVYTSKELDYVEAKDLDKDSPEFKKALESLNRL